jgi:crossover junction endodeoxyribonuclease RuvC
MIVLGIDPGFSCTGYAILKKEGSKTFLLDFGYLKLPQSKSLQERVVLFHDALEKKILHFAVTDLAIETPFLGKNAQNFLKLGYLRGILYFLSHRHSLTLHEFAPTQIKQSLTGFGGASKEQVSRVLFQLFPTLAKPDKYDATDALAISLCGLWQTKNKFLGY